MRIQNRAVSGRTTPSSVHHRLKTAHSIADLLTMNGLTVVSEQPKSAQRPPILFIHGLLGGAWYFEKYQNFFSALGYPTYAVNLRGHHDSRPVPDIGSVRILDYVDDALEAASWLTSLKLTTHDSDHRPIVIGHSMGGLIAQKLAEANAVRAAVLLGPAPPRGIPLIGGTLLLRQMRYLPTLLRSRPIAGTLADNQALTLNRMPSEEHASLHARFVPDSGRAGLDILLGVPVDESRVRCPMLVVSATDDKFVPARVARRVAQKYSAAFHQYVGHAHFILWEPGWQRPVEEIEQWLDRAVGCFRHKSPGVIHLQQLGRQRGKEVRLSFADGHVVQAKVISVDFEEPAEIVYEVRSVIDIGPPHMAETKPGRVAAAPLQDVFDFEIESEQ